MADSAAAFEAFVRSARPRLTRALAGDHGLDAGDAASEAIAYAWEHWSDIETMGNPVGYLYRVAQSRARRRREPVLPPPQSIGLPDIEPRLLPALLRLPPTQRSAVWLVHACGWTYAEVAEALGTTTSMVGNHVSRALVRLRSELDAEEVDRARHH